jgi:pimeloyl-ACP methyl ester carboxylesterase
MSEPHILLIHGAWQGSWAFDAWRPLLQAAGWRAHAVDLPGNGAHNEGQADLSGYTRHVLQHLERLDGPAVVLGHSGGGITASQVAEAAPERVASLVYLAGMMLPSGCSYGALVDQCRAADRSFRYEGIDAHLQWDAARGSSRVPADAALQLFMYDCDPIDAAQAAARLTSQPESGRAMVNQLSAERFGRVPRVYVECLHDRSVTLPLQRRMQARSPGAKRLSMACGHVPQLACPATLNEVLLPVLQTMRQAPSPAGQSA